MLVLLFLLASGDRRAAHDCHGCEQGRVSEKRTDHVGDAPEMPTVVVGR